MQETRVWSPGGEDLLEEEMAILSWKILWTVEPGGLHTVHGSQGVGYNWARMHAHNILNPIKWKIYILFLKGSFKNLIRSLPTKSGFSPCCTQEESGMLVYLQRPYNAGEQGHRGTYKGRREGPTRSFSHEGRKEGPNASCWRQNTQPPEL